MSKRIIVVQQFYYPDLSAVAQLLHDLLDVTASHHGRRFTVLASSTVRVVEDSDDRPVSAENETIRFPAPFGAKLGTVGRLADSLVFHVCVFVYLLFVRRDSCVVSMTTPPLIGLTVALASHFRPARFIHYIEDLFPEILLDTGIVRRPYIAKKLSLFNRITLRAADGIVVVGEKMRRKLYLNYGVNPEVVDVVENWAAPIEHSEPDLSGPPVFMYSGNLGYAHGFRYLKQFVDAFRGSRSGFVFVGAGRRYAAVKRELRSGEGVEVRFMPYVSRSEHSHVLATASFFLLAQSPRTVGDLLPSKYYSYLAAGRPIVYFGTRQSEIGQTIDTRNLGVIIETEDDLAASLSEVRGLIADSEKYKRVCERVRTVHREHGGVRVAAERFASVLSSAGCGD